MPLPSLEISLGKPLGGTSAGYVPGGNRATQGIQSPQEPQTEFPVSALSGHNGLMTTMNAPGASPMTQIRIALLAMTLPILALAGCAAQDGDRGDHMLTVVGPASPDGAPEQLMLESVVGREEIIQLPSNAGTGYTWSMTTHSEGIELVGAPTTEPIQKDLPGGEVMTRFTLRMNKAGRQTARLELARTWETDVPAARLVNVIIKVDGNS